MAYIVIANNSLIPTAAGLFQFPYVHGCGMYAHIALVHVQMLNLPIVGQGMSCGMVNVP